MRLSWKKALQRYAIEPVQQFAYTTGKTLQTARSSSMRFKES